MHAYNIAFKDHLLSESRIKPAILIKDEQNQYVNHSQTICARNAESGQINHPNLFEAFTYN